MNYTKEESINKLTGYLNEKFSILEDILSITKLQKEALSEEGMDKLYEHIDEKQKKIDLINEIDNMFLNEYKALKNILGIIDEDDLSKTKNSELKIVKDTTDKILKKLKEIQDIENSNKEKADELLCVFNCQIKNSNKDKIARLAYGKSSYSKPPSYFIDKKK